jgi:hypothetical protein
MGAGGGTVEAGVVEVVGMAEVVDGSGATRDGNGDPIPDSPRGIPLLGDGYGTNLVPAGI